MPHDRRKARLFLNAGMLAGPLVVATALVQAVTRTGFDWRRHANSQLALGEGGWVQSANFILCALLVGLLALGMRRVLRGGPGGLWAPIMLGLFAVTSMGAGLFPTDPMAGFPLGAVSPATPSWHANLHAACGGIGISAIGVAGLVLARYFGRMRQAGWALASAAIAVAIFGTALWAGAHMGTPQGFDYLPLWICWIAMWTWVCAVSWKLRQASSGTRVDG